MKKNLALFLVIFGIISGCFCNQSCTSPNFLWCTSSGIVTYNKHTGQFEMLWENRADQIVTVHDTIYITSDSLSIKP